MIAAFGDLGWPAVSTGRDEVGTDVLAMPRTEDLLDLGTLVGAQVKTGASWFDELEQEGDEVVGWWFRESDRNHADYWLSHTVPHIIVLRRPGPGPSFWGQITRESVKSTGKGIKIFVPARQRIDENGRSVLEAVARAGRKPSTVEGTAWRKVGDLPTSDRLRYALIAPRLISPHPNALTDEPVSAETAVALLAEARLTDLDRFHALSQEDAVKSDDWAWQFFGALAAWLRGSDFRLLRRLAGHAPAKGFHIAAAVVAASVMIERGNPDEAVELLRGTVQTGGISAVDVAWRDMQLARGLVEIGQIEEARRLAVGVYGIGSSSPDDVTALAMSGGAAILLFNTSRWDEADVAQVVTAADTVARWWVMITEYQGLAAGVSETFMRWARTARFVVNSGVPELNKLASAAFVAGTMGDQADWAATRRLLAMQMLSWTDTNEATEDHREALEFLIAAGDKQTVSDAVSALISNGPADLVREIAARTEFETLTRTTAPSTLALLQRGADVLDPDTADRAVAWLLRTIKQPRRFVRRTRPSYLTELELIEVLESVVRAARRAKQRLVVQALVKLPRELLDLEEEAWARVIRALDADAWTPALRSRARTAARRRTPPLRMALLAVASDCDPTARSALFKEIRNGSVEALSSVRDMRTLTRSTAQRAIEHRAAQVRREIADSQRGTIKFGSERAAADLVILNAWHPDSADWDAVADFLEADTVPVSQKHEVLLGLCGRADEIPEKPRKRIVAASEHLADAPPSDLFSPVEQTRDVWPAATLFGISAGQDELQADRRVAKLLALGVRHKQWAPLIAGESGRALDLGLIVALVSDPDPRIRSSAAEPLARAVAAGEGGEIARAVLTRACEDPGVEVPYRIAVGLRAIESDDVLVSEIMEKLRGHISAAVRRAAAAG